MTIEITPILTATGGNIGTLVGTEGIPVQAVGSTTATFTTAANISTYVTSHAGNNTNVINTVVKRDGSGNFSAGTITANLTGNASGTAANITGTAAIANGGTGQTTAAMAINALLPAQSGNTGFVLGTNGSVASWVASGIGAVKSQFNAAFTPSATPTTVYPANSANNVRVRDFIINVITPIVPNTATSIEIQNASATVLATLPIALFATAQRAVTMASSNTIVISSAFSATQTNSAIQLVANGSITSGQITVDLGAVLS